MTPVISDKNLALPQQAPGETQPVDAQRGLPLSFAQQQVWRHAEVVPALPIYNHSLIIKRTSDLDRDVIGRSLREITVRHSALRTAITSESPTPAQVISGDASIDISYTELEGLEEEERSREICRTITEQALQPFHLAKSPLLRVRVLEISDGHHLIVLTVHAIIADERSLGLLAHELASCYDAFSRGEVPYLAKPPLQYGDYALWQKRHLQGDILEGHVSYWRERLAGIPPALDLPTDRPRPPAPSYRGAHHLVTLPQELTESLKVLSEREDIELSFIYLAAFQALLSRYTGQDDIITGVIANGRVEPGTEESVGLFANAIVIRTAVGDDVLFGDILRQVSNSMREGCNHQNVPFHQLLTALDRESEPGRDPIFQVLFSMRPSMPLLQPGWSTVDLPIESGTSKVDLELQLLESNKGICARFAFSTDLFEGATIRRIAGHYTTLLQGIIADPGSRLSKLPLLNDTERHELLVKCNNTRTDYAQALCVHQLFEAQVDRTPDTVAILFDGDGLTYAELNRRANRLAHYLANHSVGPDVLVGICIERSLDMVVALLGILKAGAAYVPLDPSYPNERLSFMLEDAGVPLLLSQRHLAEGLPQTAAKVLFVDAIWDQIGCESSENLSSTPKAENLAYVIYTSGSTGKPKGVQIEHRAVVNFLSSMIQCPGISSEDRLLAITTLSFDIAGLEIYLPLSVGACVDIVSRNVASDGKELLTKLKTSGATILQATPATWRMLLEAGWEGSPHLKALCGGEAWSRGLANQLLQRTASLWNMYGPTETTIWSTTAKVEPGEGALTIGRPIANTKIFILDKRRQPVPVGVAGELYIGGDGLARGYLKRPELTAEKFVVNPFSQDPEARLYRTGDLARYLVTGKIEFLGRIDHQVKIRGFRIEIGEIETALRKRDDVKETVVVAREDATGEQRLVAYVVPAREAAPTVTELRRFLKDVLPEHMIPSTFVPVRVMPLTPNGKIDRRALPAPDKSDLMVKDKLAEPTDMLEARLVTIWENALDVRPIGVRHNFFELGGHSLVAVRVMQRMEEAFGMNLPIATLLQAPTIEQFAQIVRRRGWSSPWSSLVPIQGTGSQTPLFCVHGAGANVILFRQLAQQLGSNQPFYGLQAQGVNEKYACHTRVEDMASHYIREIRSVQPKGPYFIAGYSFGGMIALEMAHQLLAESEQPSTVILFDTLCTAAKSTPFANDVTSVPIVLRKIFRAPSRERSAYLSRFATAPVRAGRRWLHVMRLPRRIKKVRKACLEASRLYTPQAYPGRLILFRSNHEPLNRVGDPYAAWNAYALHGLESYEIEGNHENILLEPQVRFVAEQLRKCLNSATQAVEVESGRQSLQPANGLGG